MVLRPSRSLALLGVASHAVVIVAVFPALDGIPLGLVLAGALLSAAWCVAKSMLWLPGGVARFEIFSDGAARWSDCRGGGYSAGTVRVSWCSEFLLLVGLRGADARWHWVPMLPDSADAHSLRCLRVWFRWRPD